MTEPTIPPEAVEAALRTNLDDGPDNFIFPGCDCESCRVHVSAMLTAAYPSLRRAILAEVVPLVVEMAREVVVYADALGVTNPHYQMPRHTPASILAALEEEV